MSNLVRDYMSTEAEALEGSPPNAVPSLIAGRSEFTLSENVEHLGDRLTDDLTFRFKDGSIYEDKTVFTQKGSFRLLSDHLVEKGPSFKQPMETLIDASTGQVAVHYKDHDGKEKVLKQKLKLPPDLANGLMFTLVKDIEPSAPRTTVSMLATTPKPRTGQACDLSRRRETPFER